MHINYKTAQQLFYRKCYIPFFISTLSFITAFQSRAESTPKKFFANSEFSVRCDYGWVWAHRPYIEHFIVAHTLAFELSWCKQRTGELPWEKTYNYPQTGYTFIYLDFAYPEVLGNANALMTFINFPIIRKKNFLFSFRTSAGLGYLTKKYERVENYKNNAIGSHMNVALQLNANTSFSISKKILFNFSFGLTHFSNGAWTKPNLGINNLSWNAGFAYRINETTKFLSPEILSPDKRLQLDVLYASGIKQLEYPNGIRYFTHTFSATLYKPLSNKSNLGLGLDVFYDLSMSRWFAIKKVQQKNKLEEWRGGIHIAYELKLNHISIIVQAGGYIYDVHNLDGILYNRYGLKYQINQHLFASVTLKTHYAKADFAEWGIGWKFKHD